MRFHHTPPLTEWRIVPLLSTNQPHSSLVKSIALSVAVVPEGRVVQFLPPELVKSILPRSPTAQPCELSIKKMFARSSRPRWVSRFHDKPPSSVRTTRPSAPAAQPIDSSEK